MSHMPPAAVKHLRPGQPTYHLLRRRARAVAQHWNASVSPQTSFRAVVRKTGTGPWRWRVDLVHREPKR